MNSLERMAELFRDPAFKTRLLELYKAGAIVEGAACPAGCGGVLKRTTLSYMTPEFHMRSIERLLRCDCGFQAREEVRK